MPEDEKKPDALPGNEGQFGTNVMTEESERLENHPTSPEPPPPTQGPSQTNAGERS